MFQTSSCQSIASSWRRQSSRFHKQDGRVYGCTRHKLSNCNKINRQNPLVVTADLSDQRREHLTRRTLVAGLATSGIFAENAQAVSEGVDKVWTAIGGGPADLYYPEEWLGSWQVTSVLTNFELPMGEDPVKDARLIQRAKGELNQPLVYEQRFIRSPKDGKIISDRVFNLESLVTASTGGVKMIDTVEWDPTNPNTMRIEMRAGGPGVFTRVTRRFQDEPADYRLDTSEFIEQVFDQAAGSGEGTAPRVKASRCLTKYKWRSLQDSKGGPSIVATQVVSDFPTAFDGVGTMIEANGRPQIVYTYKMAFERK